MEPRQAWGVLGLLLVLADAVACVLLWTAGIGAAPVATFGIAVAITFGYVAYKRYNLEVVPEEDLMLFDDPDDLALLCGIYGLEQDGDALALRARLVEFARRHRDEAFVWVAPRAVMSVGNALSIGSARPSTRRRTARPEDGSPGLRQVRKGIRSCPVCDTPVQEAEKVCGECGADLGLFESLSGKRVGRLVLSDKRARAVRRKLRYEVPSLGGPR